MFTGIVEAVGRLSRSGRRLRVSCGFDDLAVGESVAVDGVCLTVVSRSPGAFTAELSDETLARTTLGTLGEAAEVNLERAVRVGGRLGGHVVQGHVDAVGRVEAVEPHGGGAWLWVSVPEGVERYLVEKGSVALDGVSLTVAALRPGRLGVALVPHTLETTTLRGKRGGEPVNVEVDVLAKYVERLLEGRATEGEGEWAR